MPELIRRRAAIPGVERSNAAGASPVIAAAKNWGMQVLSSSSQFFKKCLTSVFKNRPADYQGGRFSSIEDGLTKIYELINAVIINFTGIDIKLRLN